MPAVEQLWWIPLPPLLSAAIGALTPRTGRRLASTVAIVAMAVAFVLSLGALRTALLDPARHAGTNFIWFELGDGAVQLGWLLDPLTALMAVMITLISLLVFVFSVGYMRDDANAARFFCFLSLFAGAMLGLVIANSLLLLFISWELVGLASYLLIGFWFEKPAAAAAARKAFITTRVGDLGLFLGLLWLQHATGTSLFYDGGHGMLEPATLQSLAAQTTVAGLAVPTVIGALLFCGAIGKSGQFPLHVWLPDAMEGPTPVSALIHAATMVAAGVFLIARVFPLMTADQALPGASLHVLSVVAAIGSITALLGALVAVAQTDIKRVLAYSTISQLGYMILALGVGAWTAAIFHLLTHAFFKALLFLGAGSVIHAAHHEQDLRHLGGLGRRMRLTFATFAIGMMALSGVPFLFSGFWSKEAILQAAHHWPVSPLPLVVALVAVVLTAFYMTRLTVGIFLGAPRSSAAAHASENGPVMTLPLVILAAGAVLLGAIGTPAWPWLQATLEGRAPVGESPFSGGGLMWLSIVLVALGIGAGWAAYASRARKGAAGQDPLARHAPRLHGALARGLGFDALYVSTVGRLLAASATAADLIDRWIIDRAVRSVGGLALLAGLAHRENDEDVLNAGFDQASRSVRASGTAYSRAQTGDAHGYLRFAVVGFVLLVVLVMMGGGW